jgi:hypothetical protein
MPDDAPLIETIRGLAEEDRTTVPSHGSLIGWSVFSGPDTAMLRHPIRVRAKQSTAVGQASALFLYEGECHLAQRRVRGDVQEHQLMLVTTASCSPQRRNLA